MSIPIMTSVLSASIGDDSATVKSLPETQNGATELTNSETSPSVTMLMTQAKQEKKKTALA